MKDDFADRRKATSSWRRAFRLVLGGLGVLLILGAAGYLAYDIWIANTVVRKTAQDAAQGTPSSKEGTDETEVSSDALDSYEVAANMPRLLHIEKLGIRARILPMGVTENNAIQAPINIFDSGWYTESARPGRSGVAFIDAHASGATREGLFAYIDTLRASDRITVERGDGTMLHYEVRELEVLNLDTIDMAKVLSPRGDIVEGLTLMTCTGKWMADASTYDQRVVVYAERV